jgi:hypothetical protein
LGQIYFGFSIYFMIVGLEEVVLCSYFPQMLMSISYEYWSSGKTEGHVCLQQQGRVEQIQK